MEHNKKEHVVKHLAFLKITRESEVLCLLNYYTFEKGAQNRTCITQHLKDSRNCKESCFESRTGQMKVQRPNHHAPIRQAGSSIRHHSAPTSI